MGIKNYFGEKKKGLANTAKETVGAKQIQDNMDYLKSLYQHVKTPQQNDAAMTFAEAVSKYKLTTNQLQLQYKAKMINFYIFLAMFAGAFVYLFYVLGNGNLWGVFSTVPFLLVSGTLAISNSLSCFQYKYKEFKSLREWFDSGEYFPATWVDMTKTYEFKNKRGF